MDVFAHDWRALLVERDGPTAVVRLNRPEKRNALSLELLGELTLVARELKSQTNIHTVIVAGADEYFSAGADLTDPERAEWATMTLLERRQRVLAGPDMCDAWEALEQITICAFEGYSIGGAVALALACDFRIAGEGASLRLPEVALGINMSWHTLPRLVALVGPARAKRFTIFCEALSAEDALAWGMIDELTTKGGAFTLAQTWAAKLAKLPPVPVRMSKEAINRAALSGAQSAIFMDRDQYLVTTGANDFKEGVDAFLEKRDPEFRGD